MPMVMRTVIYRRCTQQARLVGGRCSGGAVAAVVVVLALVLVLRAPATLTPCTRHGLSGLARQFGSLDIVFMLLDHGANVNKQRRSTAATPLYVAAQVRVRWAREAPCPSRLICTH